MNRSMGTGVQGTKHLEGRVGHKWGAVGGSWRTLVKFPFQNEDSWKMAVLSAAANPKAQPRRGQDSAN